MIENFGKAFIQCMESSPELARNIKQVLQALMRDFATKEDYETASRYRDLVRFIDKRILRGEKSGEETEMEG